MRRRLFYAVLARFYGRYTAYPHLANESVQFCLDEHRRENP